MSLINDALKRAKNAQQKSPPTAPEPELLRPAESTPAPERGLGVMLPIIIILVVVLSLLLLWVTRQKAAVHEPVAATKPFIIPTPAPETKPVQVVVVSAPPIKPQPAPVAHAPSPSVTILPSPPRLQAIFYSPGHSTAMINGKTVRAGDVIKGYRVATITETSATLFNATQTNVMTLEQ